MRTPVTVQRMVTLGGALLLTLILAVPVAAAGNGARQVSGVGYPDLSGACTELPFDYVIVMTGDLKGCVYGVVTSSHGPGPSGVYKERATETFVGSYKGRDGTFRMTEDFHARFDLDSGNEIFGFCQHPIVRGSGTGDFAGVRGRLSFRDDVDDPADVSYPYKGHFRNLG